MNRATVFASISNVLDYIKDVNKPGTGDMFQTREEKLAMELEPMQDWPLATRLWMERRSLGTWISGHPLDLVRSKYEHKVEYRLRDIPALLDLPTQTYRLAFIIRKVFVVKQKIVIVIVEDETGVGEVNAFASDCDPWWHLLKKDVMLVAQCMPRHNGKFSSMHFQRLHKLGELVAPTALAIPQKRG